MPFADQADTVTTGQVTKLIPFGAFVRFADGVEGIVHSGSSGLGFGLVQCPAKNV